MNLMWIRLRLPRRLRQQLRGLRGRFGPEGPAAALVVSVVWVALLTGLHAATEICSPPSRSSRRMKAPTRVVPSAGGHWRNEPM